MSTLSVETSCDVTRLPLGRPDFSDIRQHGDVYVDKTALIYGLARLRVPLFLSRPRRFGKSLLVSTLQSLFAGKLEDFQGLAIDGHWQDTSYRVVRIDFSGLADLNVKEINRELGEILLQNFGVYGKISALDEKGEYRLPSSLLREIANSLQNSSTVLLIDEYDAPLTHHLDKTDELQKITSIFNNFYAIVKEYTSKFRFIFITGVTRIAHVSIFSAFNNLRDMSFENKYNTLLGFTQDDIRCYFDQYIDNAAQVLGMSKDAVYTRLEQCYDGYQVAFDSDKTLYNPWSILSFLQKNT